MSERQYLSQSTTLEAPTLTEAPRSSTLSNPSFIAGVFVVMILVAVIILGRNILAEVAGPFLWIVVILIAAIAVVVAVLCIVYAINVFDHKRQMLRLERELKEAEIERSRIASRKFDPDMAGNYAAYLHESGQFLQPTPGNVIQPVPNTYSPHITYHQTALPQLTATGSPAETVIGEVHVPTFAQLLDEDQFGGGEMIIGIRADGTLRTGEWNDLMIFGVWGGTHSGKTTTVAEKTCEAAIGGAWLIVCDPHLHKKDSLANKIKPLAHLLYPGTKIAADHDDILKNVERANKILEMRVKGADCSRPVVLIVEEWNRLQRDEDIAKALTKIVKSIGQEGRGFNVYAIIAGQETSGESQVRKALAAHIVHRIAESESSKVLPSRHGKYTPELPIGCSMVLDTDGLIEKLYQPLLTVQDVMIVAEMTRVSIEPSSQPSTEPSTDRLPLLPEKTVSDRPVDGVVDDPEKVSLVKKMLQERQKQTDIVKTVWGITETAGTRYTKAVEEFRAIVAYLLSEQEA